MREELPVTLFRFQQSSAMYKIPPSWGVRVRRFGLYSLV